MSSSDAPGNGESQACASCLARAGLVHAVKAFAQVRQVFGRDTDPAVTDLQEGLFLARVRAHGYTTSAPVIFDGVIQQHQQRLFQQQRVPNHTGIVGGLHLDSDASLLGQGLHASHGHLG